MLPNLVPLPYNGTVIIYLSFIVFAYIAAFANPLPIYIYIISPFLTLTYPS